MQRGTIHLISYNRFNQYFNTVNCCMNYWSFNLSFKLVDLFS